MGSPTDGPPLFLLDLALRSVVLLLAAHAAASLLKGRSAAGRDLLWTAAFVGLLALPACGALLPAVHLPADWVARAGASDAWAERLVDVEPAAVSGPMAEVAGKPPPGGMALGNILVGIWALGALLLLASLALRHFRAALVVRASVALTEAGPFTEAGWTRDLARISRRLGITRPMEIRISGRVSVPVIYGVLRPRLLLPADARGWSAERRRVVLLHELAHVRRRDILSQLLVDAACALHWPNPLAWAGRARFAAAREEACDDVVLGAGVAGEDYARQMIGLARRLAGPRLLAPAGVSMARPSGLERRLRSILDRNRSRDALPGRLRFGILVAVLGVSWPLASGTFSDGAADAEARAHAAWMLGENGATEAESALVDALDDPSAEVRSQVAWALGELDLTSAGPALVRTLADGDPDVRHQAAWALGEMRVAAAVPSLIDLLDDPEPEVRESAAWALGELGEPATSR